MHMAKAAMHAKHAAHHAEKAQHHAEKAKKMGHASVKHEGGIKMVMGKKK
jgi:hypothetical protein